MTVPLIASASAGAVSLAILGIRRRYVLVTVAGLSMAPTLRPGDRVLVRRSGVRRVRTGDIVVFRPAGAGPELPIIKRAAALPGDLVPRDVRAERHVHTERDVLDEPDLPGAVAARDTPGEPHDIVPSGKLVLFGDNPAFSADSRQSGYFDERRLIGFVIRRFPATPAESSS